MCACVCDRQLMINVDVLWIGGQTDRQIRIILTANLSDAKISVTLNSAG